MKKILFIALVIILSLNVYQAHADISTGLVGWWKFDEGSGSTVADSSGNGNTATSNNGATFTTGKIGPYAGSFDGINDYFHVPGNSAFYTAFPFSIAGWVNTTDTSNTVIAEVNQNTGWSWQTFSTGSRPSCLFVNLGGTGVSGTGPSTCDGTWHHYAFVFTSTSDTKTYIDGVDRSSVVSGGTPSYGSGSLDFGSRAGAAAWPGSLDDFRIYSRALTAGDVAQLYNYRGGAANLVQSKVCYPSTTSCSFDNPVTAGDLLIYTNTGLSGVWANTVSDSLGDTVQTATTSVGFSTGEGFAIYYIENATGGAHTFNRQAGNDIAMHIAEVSGIVTSNSLDTVNVSNSIGTTNAPTTNSTTTTANDFIYAAYTEESAVNTGSAGANYTFIGEAPNQYGATEYRVAAAGNYTAPFVINSGSFSHWMAGLAAFKTASAASPSTFTSSNFIVSSIFKIFGAFTI